MNENQQNFESLRRLLALKRHETPPPGYFNHFSRQVVTRIRTGQAAEAAGIWGHLVTGTPWLFKWFQGVETRSVFAGSFATALCLLLLFGVVIAQRPESPAQAFLRPTPETTPFATIAVGAPTTPTSVTPVSLEQPNQIMIADNSTNPLIDFQSASLLQGRMPGPQFVTFPISGD